VRPPFFSDHAREQGLERDISEADALHVLRTFSKIEPTYAGRHNVWGYTPAGRRIRVTIHFESNTVVTLANADGRRS
jgi:hypothetical protein